RDLVQGGQLGAADDDAQVVAAAAAAAAEGAFDIGVDVDTRNLTRERPHLLGDVDGRARALALGHELDRHAGPTTTAAEAATAAAPRDGCDDIVHGGEGAEPVEQGGVVRVGGQNW